MNEDNRQKTLEALNATSIGHADFVARHDLAATVREELLAKVLAEIDQRGIEVIRFSVIDTHGQLRVRPIEARLFAQTIKNGVPFSTAHFSMDSGNVIFKPLFSAEGGFGRAVMGGGGDMLAIPDLATFRVIPWAKRSAVVFADLYLKDGELCPLDPRAVMRRACASLADQGFLFVAGVEVECHVFKVDDPRLSLEDCTQPPQPPRVSLHRHGYQYMSEHVLDEYEPVIEPIRRALIDLGLPLRTLECEWGPGQLEITFDPLIGLDAADAVILMRSAVKQVARRMGMIATFMTKPALPNIFSSGWHLHQSLAHIDGTGNAFFSPDETMSDTGMHFVGGILKHARATTAFSNPTINGYKRLISNPLTPKRAIWSIDNRGAMCRLVGGAGNRSTHVENRSGEPLANPYLYMAGQIYSGLDGLANKEDPGDPLGDPYADTTKPLLPGNLAEAIDALDGSEMYRATIGDEFIDHYVSTKRNEIGRFAAHVTDWEHREYFEAY